MSGIFLDLRYAARGLWRSPGLAVTLLVTIALGVGGGVTILAFTRGLTTHGAGIADTSRVVSVFGRDERRGVGAVSYDEYRRMESRTDLVEWMGAARVSQRAMRVADQAATLAVAEVTPGMAEALGLSLNGGAVIGRHAWQSEFGGEAEAGKSVRLAPEGLEGVYSDRPIDLWMPLDEDSLGEAGRKTRNVWVLARLRPHVSAAQLEDAVRTGGGPHEMVVRAYTGMSPEMAEGLGRTSTMLHWATAVVLFIACVNVAAFLLGRAAVRWRATSIRVALGASRGRLAQAVACDSLVIAGSGGALSVLLAMATSRVIPALLFEQDAQFLVLAPDVWSVTATAGLGAAVVMAGGLLPLLETRYDQPAAVLGREGQGPSPAARKVRASLVVAQMACCCLLAICTGFLYGGFRSALETGAGRRLGEPILATVHAPREMGAELGYFRRIEETARTVGGVSGRMVWAARLPGSQAVWQSFRVDRPGGSRRAVGLEVAGFTARSVEEFRWPPRVGRSFGLRDQGCRAAMANEGAARALFGDDSVGRTVWDEAGTPVEIIGVVEARKGTGAAGGPPTLYFDETNAAGRPRQRMMARFSAGEATKLERAELNTNVVSAGYFGAMGLSLVRGRLFAEDAGESGCRVAVVNDQAADVYFGGNALGAALIDDLGTRTEIVGVVHAAQLGVFERRAEPTVYFPMRQDPLQTMTLIVGTRVASAAIEAEVRSRLGAVTGGGPGQTVVKTLEAHLSQTSLAPLRIAMALVGACAASALFLGGLGLYGTLNDAARARRRDLAIRIAVGARRRHVIGLVLGEGGRLAGLGAAAGTATSLLVWEWLRRSAWSVAAPRPWEWIAGPLLLALAVSVASILPARRALLADPIRILRGGN